MPRRFLPDLLALALLLAGSASIWPASETTPASANAFYGARFSRQPGAAELSALGRTLFFDPGLSASGRIACASCHDPDHAYGPPNALPVQTGGALLNQPGLRAVPSLRYLQNVPPFTEHFHDNDGDDGVDQGPAGGRTWDGRAASAHEQARLPLLSPLEMGNADADAVVAKVRQAAYARRFEQAFGADVFADPQRAFDALLLALEVFQQEPAEFYPYSSKYDAVLRRQAKLNEQEARGLALFNDPAKGNCASCHPSGIREGAFPVFSDFGYVALGVPRNTTVPANADPAYHDLGLCGPLRQDLKSRTDYCGMFRSPTLRNVAQRPVYFHNGVFGDLKQVLRFYVDRDLHPERWYARGADGRVEPFDDLPPAYRTQVNRVPPLDRKPGDAPALSEAEIDDVIAFLKTLDDGWKP